MKAGGAYLRYAPPAFFPLTIEFFCLSAIIIDGATNMKKGGKRIMKKKLWYLLLLPIFLCIILFVLSQDSPRKILNDLDIVAPNTYEFSCITETHSGFHNDGVSCYCFEGLSVPTSQDFYDMNGWHVFPLDTALACIIYGGTIDHTFYQPLIGCIPTITAGAWYFKDLQRPQTEYTTDDILKVYAGASANFIVAVWDLEKDILYYARYDS